MRITSLSALATLFVSAVSIDINDSNLQSKSDSSLDVLEKRDLGGIEWKCGDTNLYSTAYIEKVETHVCNIINKNKYKIVTNQWPKVFHHDTTDLNLRHFGPIYYYYPLLANQEIYYTHRIFYHGRDYILVRTTGECKTASVFQKHKVPADRKPSPRNCLPGRCFLPKYDIKYAQCKHLGITTPANNVLHSVKDKFKHIRNKDGK